MQPSGDSDVGGGNADVAMRATPVGRVRAVASLVVVQVEAVIAADVPVVKVVDGVEAV